MSSYHEHYARVSDLSVQERELASRCYEALYRPLLTGDRAARILDFGCGGGLLLEWLKHLGYKDCQGLDADLGQVEFARTLDINAHYVSHPIEWLQSSGRFDAIFMIDVLEHLPAITETATLAAIHDALAPGGTLILRTPNANSAFASRYRYGDPTHHRSYTEESLSSRLRQAGFDQVEIREDDDWRVHSLPGSARLTIKRGFRVLHRLEAMAEFGPKTAAAMHFSLNLIAISTVTKS